MIKVNYDTKTTLVLGYYPDSINYASIPEPFIKIEDGTQDYTKQMCVIDGVYQEYVLSDSILLEEAKIAKIAEVKLAREIFQYANLTVGSYEFKSTQNAKLLFFSKVNGSASAEYPIDWLLADDVSWVSLSKTESYAIYVAMEAQETSAYKQASVFYSAINTASSIEELAAINIKFE